MPPSDNQDEIDKAVARAVWEKDMAQAIEGLADSVHALTERVQQLEKRYLIVCGVLILLGQAVGIGVGEILQHFLGASPAPLQ